jgi:Zn-dependent protease with chaperone function
MACERDPRREAESAADRERRTAEPKVTVADNVRSSPDPEALTAALAHEHVHVRHRDPLRIWLAHGPAYDRRRT